MKSKQSLRILKARKSGLLKQMETYSGSKSGFKARLAVINKKIKQKKRK